MLKIFCEGRYTRADIDDTAKALGVPVLRHWRHSSEYDSNLTAIIFLRIMDDLITLEKNKKTEKFSEDILYLSKEPIEEEVF